MHRIDKKENGTICWSVGLIGKDHLKDPTVRRGWYWNVSYHVIYLHSVDPYRITKSKQIWK